MLAAFVGEPDSATPLAALQVGEVPLPEPPSGWARVRVRAASLNQHDVWALRGAVQLERHGHGVLGLDAAGETEDGQSVVVHAVLTKSPPVVDDETMDPTRTVLPDGGHGCLAEYVTVPRRNLVPMPVDLDWAEAACLPTAWLTAYRMLFTRAQARPGETVLVQGAGGSVATATIVLAKAAGLTVVVSTQSQDKAERAREIGAHDVVLSGERFRRPVDIVVDSVGEPTWRSSVSALRSGGRLVVCGATGGFAASTNLSRVFSKQLSILGSTMGTLSELRGLVAFLEATRARPVIDSVRPLAEVGGQFERLMGGAAFGKLVVVT